MFLAFGCLRANKLWRLSRPLCSLSLDGLVVPSRFWLGFGKKEGFLDGHFKTGAQFKLNFHCERIGPPLPHPLTNYQRSLSLIDSLGCGVGLSHSLTHHPLSRREWLGGAQWLGGSAARRNRSELKLKCSFIQSVCGETRCWANAGRRQKIKYINNK